MMSVFSISYGEKITSILYNVLGMYYLIEFPFPLVELGDIYCVTFTIIAFISCILHMLKWRGMAIKRAE